jgi:putative PEP-CTERM system histidine kinase
MSMSAVLDAGCSATYLFLAVLLLVRGTPSRTGMLLAGASLITASWAAAAIVLPPALGGMAGALEMARGVGWYGFVLHLYRRSVPGNGRIRQIFAVLGWAVALASIATLLIDTVLPDAPVSLASIDIELRLGLAMGTLLLIENLYRSTPEDMRWHINLACVALGGLCLYDMALYSDAVLFRRISPLLLAGRPAATAMVAPLLAVAAARNRGWGIDIHVSRTVVFHSATLILCGLFLLGLAAAGEIFRQLGADWGMVAEACLMFGGVVTIGVLLTSGSFRARLRALLLDHFFSYRYDYRREWARCIATLSIADTYIPLHTRVIRAIAEVVDSPGGALFLRETENGAFHWTGSWNMPAVTATVAASDPLLAQFRDGSWIVEAAREVADFPWQNDLTNVWLVVPLGHAGRLLGFILVAKSRSGFKLDHEVFDLLRIVGREGASFIAEQRAMQALLQAQQLRDYGRRFAFVAHDIKNVSNQLSLLLANAEHYLGDPEFQRDMLATLRASVQKIGTLLARLQAPESGISHTMISPAEQLEAIVTAYRRTRHAIIVLESDSHAGSVVIDAEAFEAAVRHLLDNAIEASAPGQPVQIRLQHEGRHVQIDIIDSGPGMAPEFIRDELFRPFGSSKPAGFGIGAFQARELLQEVGGDLVALSQSGLGTTMRLLLPLVGESVQQAAPCAA